MCVHDFPADGQAKSCAASTCLGLAALDEFVKDMLQFILRNSRTIVPNFDLQRRHIVRVRGTPAMTKRRR